MAHSLALTIRRLTIATLILIGTFAFSPLTRADISAPNPTASTNWFFIPQTSSGIDILGLEGEKVPFRASITNTSNNDGNPGTEMEYGGLGSIQNPGDIDFMSHYTDAPGVPGSPVIKPGTDNPQIYSGYL